MQDAHLAPRFFVAGPNLFADHSKFCVELRDVTSELRDVTSKLRDIAFELREITAQGGKVGNDGGYLVGQLA